MAVSNLYRASSSFTHSSVCLSLRLKLNKFDMFFFLFWYHICMFLLYRCRDTFTLVTVYITSGNVVSTIAKQKISKIHLLPLKNYFQNMNFSSYSVTRCCGCCLSKRLYCFLKQISLSFFYVGRGNVGMEEIA